MFRGKESSNRIELSRLVSELLKFGVFGSLRLWGGGRWVGGCLGAWGCPHMHAHAHTHVYMYRNCKWPPAWRHPCLACLTCMCMHACTYVCMCACMKHPHTLMPTPTPIHPSATPHGDPQNQLKFDNT